MSSHQISNNKGVGWESVFGNRTVVVGADEREPGSMESKGTKRNPGKGALAKVCLPPPLGSLALSLALPRGPALRCPAPREVPPVQAPPPSPETPPRSLVPEAKAAPPLPNQVATLRPGAGCVSGLRGPSSPPLSPWLRHGTCAPRLYLAASSPWSAPPSTLSTSGPL